MHRLKKLVWLTIPWIIGGILLSIGLVVHVQAQTGRDDDFTFFIPFHSDIILEHFKTGNNEVNQATDLSVQTIISISVNRTGTTIYYDHWEDGYETELTLSTQSSTQIWGDGNTANGVAPTVRDQGGGDALLEDDVILLGNRVLLPNGARDPAVIYYDGGDTLIALGGSIAVTEVIWPLEGDTEFPGSLYTDAWELHPTSRWGQAYQVPVGVDLATLRGGFTVVGITVQAKEADTVVTLTDKDGNLKTSKTLGFGEEFSQPNGINVGDQIQATAPVQVQFFTADPTRNYEERGGSLVPIEKWSNDYLAPRSSDGDFWLYNPQTTPLTVTVDMTAMTDTVVIPPGQTIRYSNNGANLSTATGMHFSADAPFYGLVALDRNEERDWGYSLQPVNGLTPQVLIGWAPGNNRIPPTGQGYYSPVYVTALTDTVVTVHYTDNTPDINVPVPALAEVILPSPNDDMTGARIFTTDGTPFLTVWGERQTAPISQPGIDAGSNIVPISSLALQKNFHLRDSLDCSGSINTGDIVRFTLQYFNNAAFGGNIDITLLDDLPSELAYITGSTQLDGTPIPDAPGDVAPFSPAAGGFVTTSTQGGTGVLTFDARVTDDTGPVINRAEASGPILGTAEASLNVPLDKEVRPILQIDKKLLNPSSGPATWDQVITFSVTITNSSNQVPITQLSLEDKFSTKDLTFLQSNLMPDIVTNGVLTWTNLVNDGLFLPNETINLLTTFRVNQVSSTVTSILNEASFNNVQNDGEITRIICSDETTVNIIAPTPTPTSTPAPTNTPPPTSPPKETPPPTMTPTSPPPGTITITPPPLASGTPTPTLLPGITPTVSLTPGISPTGTGLPVTLLPETGQGSMPPRWYGIGVLALGLLLWLIRRRGD